MFLSNHLYAAMNEDDLNIFTKGLVEAEAITGKKYLGRSAASFVAARAGIPPVPLISTEGTAILY